MKLTDDGLPIDQLAQLNSDQGISMLAILPVGIIVVLVIAGTALYFFRRGKNWNDLGEAMREGDEPQPSSFGTREFEKIPPAGAPDEE